MGWYKFWGLQGGADIDGVSGSGYFGYSVSLSADEPILRSVLHWIIMVPLLVYSWDAGASAWMQKGGDIDGGETMIDWWGAA